MHCTVKQWAAVALWNSGYGYRRIGVLLGIDTSTARQRVTSGIRRAGMDYEEVITRNEQSD
jgi:hypothetical protein